MKLTNKRYKTVDNRDAFTLMELMVATSILVVIVVMVAAVFRQSSLAWDSGIESSRGNMNARAVLNSVQRELALAVNAVDYGRATALPQLSNNSIQFIAVGGEHVNTDDPERRALRLITYTFSGDSLKRSEVPMKCINGVWSLDTTKRTDSTVANELVRVEFTANGDDRQELPIWVDIVLEHNQDAQMFSALCAYSRGPNGEKDGPYEIDGDKNEDDIYGW